MIAQESIWRQVYDPLNNPTLSTLAAALPVVVLLGGLAVFKLRAHNAAMLGLAASLIIAIWGFGMPLDKALSSAGLGAAYGLLPIGWIILNVIFLYTLTCEAGYFAILRDSLTGITRDQRLQLLLIAFCFGAFFEGAAGFGTPVAVTAAMLMGLGFSPLQASSLSLIANTAPVAYGALGTPVIALANVTQLDIRALSAMIGRQLPFFSLIVPFWLVWAHCGFSGMVEIWPALVTAGVCFAVPQFLVSNLHGPWLVDIIASLCSMSGLVLLLFLWQPRQEAADALDARNDRAHTRMEIVHAWLPWVILSAMVFAWGLPSSKALLDRVGTVVFQIPRLHLAVYRMPPIVSAPSAERAVFTLNTLSATGTAILLAAIMSSWVMGFSARRTAMLYVKTLWEVRYSLLTVSAMIGISYVTRYAGADGALGLAFARTGPAYPFFGTLLGWVGVALTGSDTASNLLFGNLQTISAAQVGVSPLLMAAANSSGGVMGKMIDAQSIVVAGTATRWYGHEGRILRSVFPHSIALAALVAALVLLQAYVFPFSGMVVH